MIHIERELTATAIRQRNIMDFKHLSNFKNVKDFNNQFEQSMLFIKDEFTKAELVALKFFKQWCVKVVGVSNARIAILVADSHKDGTGISRSTFRRMLNKARALGLITWDNTKRENGSYSSNVYAFNRYESVVNPAIQHTEDVAVVSESTTIEVAKDEQLNHLDTVLLSHTSQDSQCLNKRREKPVSTENYNLDSSYTFKDVPKEFVDTVKVFQDDAIKISSYWKRAIWTGKELFVHNQETLVHHATRAYIVLNRRIRTVSKPLKNAFGYFQNTLRKMLKDAGMTAFTIPTRKAIPVAVKTVQPLHIDSSMDAMLDMMDEEWAIS